MFVNQFDLIFEYSLLINLIFGKMKLYGLGHLSFGNLIFYGHISQHGEDI
ncbi:hypothetical protein M6B38_143185 [Iris pallida]|uniref:Uncharacterized protein n=1 Tax=Iris pallida TaxID=29817 RepID=A0AAX6FCX3_IRIPA|nr:hypothetical protein M6B38_143185 [Iris pallida]